MDSAGSPSDWASGAAAAATGLGILTFALFPLAVPIVILTIVATLPLALPVVVLALAGAILVGIWAVLRAVVRGLGRLGRRAPIAPMHGAAKERT
jgi:O-antigen/teichoic acid export membrane protein